MSFKKHSAKCRVLPGDGQEKWLAIGHHSGSTDSCLACASDFPQALDGSVRLVHPLSGRHCPFRIWWKLPPAHAKLFFLLHLGSPHRHAHFQTAGLDIGPSSQWRISRYTTISASSDHLQLALKFCLKNKNYPEGYY